MVALFVGYYHLWFEPRIASPPLPMYIVKRLKGSFECKLMWMICVRSVHTFFPYSFSWSDASFVFASNGSTVWLCLVKCLLHFPRGMIQRGDVVTDILCV